MAIRAREARVARNFIVLERMEIERLCVARAKVGLKQVKMSGRLRADFGFTGTYILRSYLSFIPNTHMR